MARLANLVGLVIQVIDNANRRPCCTTFPPYSVTTPLHALALPYWPSPKQKTAFLILSPVHPLPHLGEGPYISIEYKNY